MVAYTVKELITILEQLDSDLPLSEGYEIELGYTTEDFFEPLESVDKKPEGSFLSVNILPVDKEELDDYCFQFVV